MIFALICILAVFLFKNAFSVYFFNDDFFFLKISRINHINDFINFFSPIRTHSFKPLATEVLYSIIHLINYNLIIAHTLVFVVFFIGLYFLYKTIISLSKSKLLALIIAGYYGINFTHTFQLYYFATFQEVALFTFLVLSFYCFIKNKTKLSLIFFVGALLSKETATLFVIFLLGYIIFQAIKKNQIKPELFKKMVLYIFLAGLFTLLYQYSLKHVTSLDNYRMIFQPQLIVNNGLWYFLWSMGAPNFTSLYFTSIFSLPIPEFYKMLVNFPEIKTYFILLIIYYLIFTISSIYYLLITNKETIIKTLFLLATFFISFFIFLGPILSFEHRWMVRLAVPLIFTVLIQGYLIYGFFNKNLILKISSIVLILFYLIINIIGIKIHESSNTFLLESRFTKNAKIYFDNHRLEIIKHSSIYFIDKTKITPMPWGGSEKLKVTLSDQNFLDHYFPGKKIKAVYNFEDKTIPKNSFIINSFDILLMN